MSDSAVSETGPVADLVQAAAVPLRGVAERTPAVGGGVTATASHSMCAATGNTGRPGSADCGGIARAGGAVVTGTPALPAGWPYHLHPGDVYGLTPEERERAAVHWLSHVGEDWYWQMARRAGSEAEAARLLAHDGRAGRYCHSSPDGYRLDTYDGGIYARYPSCRWGRLTWLDLARRARMGRGAAPVQGVLL